MLLVEKKLAGIGVALSDSKTYHRHVVCESLKTAGYDITLLWIKMVNGKWLPIL